MLFVVLYNVSSIVISLAPTIIKTSLSYFSIHNKGDKGKLKMKEKNERQLQLTSTGTATSTVLVIELSNVIPSYFFILPKSSKTLFFPIFLTEKIIILKSEYKKVCYYYQ